MQLQVSKDIKKKVITIELETINFTGDENLMLDELDEPVINFQKSYHSTSINISKRIRSQFKLKVKFDGNADTMDIASQDCDQFIEDITTVLEDSMSNLKFEYSSDLKSGVTDVDIKY